MIDSVSLDRIKTEAEYNLTTLYEKSDEFIDGDSPFQYSNNTCDYHEIQDFHRQTEDLKDPLSYFHLNCRGLSANWESFYNLICELHDENFSFDLIGISEVYKYANDSRINLKGYHSIVGRHREDGPRGGVGLFIKDNINFIIREDISVFIPHVIETIFIEIINESKKNVLVGVIYRPNTEPRADLDIYSSNLYDIMDSVNQENKHCVIMGDMNIDLLKFELHAKTNDYLDGIFEHGFLPVISKPTRMCASSATLIDHIYTNDVTSVGYSGIIITDVADHFGTFYITRGKHKHIETSKIKIRILSRNNINKFKTLLDQTDFSHILQIACPNTAYNEFVKLYTEAFEKSFPLRQKSNKTNNIKREPWFTIGLLISSRKKI